MKVKNAKVVVCGAGGFIGGHLVKSLLENGANVIRAVDVKPLDEWYQRSPGVSNQILDLKDERQLHEGGARRAGYLSTGS